MNGHLTHLAYVIAAPVVAAGIAAGALLGAGHASAAATTDPARGLVAVPQTTAQPAASATPGNWWHRHHPSLLDPTAAANFRAPGQG